LRHNVLGGNLEVKFIAEHDRYANVVLSGPTQFVFKGTLSL